MGHDAGCARASAAGTRYAVDLRGHGDSEWAADGDYTLDAFAGDVLAISRALDVRPRSSARRSAASRRSPRSANTPTRTSPARSSSSTSRRASRSKAGCASARSWPSTWTNGFGSLDEVADAIQAYNPHRPRPTNLDGLEKNLRQRDDGRWYWHWDPAFIGGRLGSPDETRSSIVDPERLQAAARALTIPTLLVRGRVSDLLSEEGAQELLQLVPHAQMVDVAGAGHMVAGDRNDLFNDAVVNFLETVR